MKFKLLVLMFVVVLLIGNVSAFEFDNRKFYDEETKTITVKNTFLGLPLDTVATIQLNTPINYRVSLGYQKVAEFNISIYEDYNQALKELELFDKKKGMKKFDREYEYKMITYEEIPNYVTVCDETLLEEGFIQKSNCQEVQSGTRRVMVTDKINSADFKKNDVVTIGIFTNVEYRDYVEWIPNFFGIRINEWATWTGALDVGLIAGYKFNETSGDLINVVDGVWNGTVNVNSRGVVNQGSPTEINTGYFFNGGGSGNKIDIQNNASGDSPIPSGSTGSVSIWFNSSHPSSESTIRLALTGADGELFTIFKDVSEWEFIVNSVTLITVPVANNNWWTAGEWVNMVFTWDDVSDTSKLYINGDLNTTSSTSFTSGVTANLDIGDQRGLGRNWRGVISEFMIWDRVVNQATITQLYNSGDGISPPATSGLLTDLISPTDNKKLNNNDVLFVINSTPFPGEILINTTLNIWNLSNSLIFENTTLLSGNQTVLTKWTINLDDGNYTWNALTFGNTSSDNAISNFSFSIETIAPIINLTTPDGDQGAFAIGNNLSVNWTVFDINLDSCFFDYNNINTTVTCGDNNFSFITVSGQQSLIFYANDTFGNLGSNTTSWTYSFLENNVTFNAEVFETSNQDFILNLTTDVTIFSISGNLNYDEVNYISTISCDSGNCLMENNIDVPLVDSGLSDTNDFFWNFTIFNGTSSNNIQTSTRQQIVNKTFLELCNATHTINTLNFTALDELNLSRIDNFQFDSTFLFWIGSGDVKRNTTYSTNGSEVNLCMKDNLNYSVDSKIDYDEFGNTTTYTSRFYYMQNKSIDSTREDISLYLLQSAFSTSFILKVQDQNLLPVEEALINIQRCYADEDECRTVQIAKTDENGKSIGFFQTETVDYKFIIVKNGVTLLETGLQKVVPETSPFTLTFNVGQDLGAPWKGSEDIVNLNSTLVFNKDTGIVTYVYIDTSTNFTSANLIVTRNSLSNSSATINVCDETSTLSSSTIFCDTGNTTGFYTASGFITRSGTGLDKQISFQIEDVSSVVGFLGLFYGFFLMLVLIFMFKFNEIAGIWLLVVSIVLLNISGLIKFGMVFVTAIIVLAIIITWLLEK